jgi:secreted Zn-dependent insulinase-like peptidase
MTVCIGGKYSLDELEKLAREKLSEVVNKNVVVPGFSDQPLFREQDLCKIVRMVPKNDTDKLVIYWNIDYMEKDFKTLPS